MMNKIKLLLLATAISVLLTGCLGSTSNQAESTTASKSDLAPDAVQSAGFMAISEDIGQVTLEKTNTPDSGDATLIQTFDDEATIAVFRRALQSAVPIQGVLKTIHPHFRFVLFSSSGSEVQRFFLWMEETSENAMLMNALETHTGYTVSKESTAELITLLFEKLSQEISSKPLSFQTEPYEENALAAKPVGFNENGYSLNGGPSLELGGTLYHALQLFHGNRKAVNALLAHTTASDEVRVVWSDHLNGTDNRWNNAFMSNFNLLLPLDENRFLFMESELTEQAGAYHLSAFNTATGAIERLRENFWPISDDYDRIYQYRWNADDQTLLLQSYLGNVWIFDLKSGEDEVHLNQFRVIPHSTTGYPSLFVSPTLKRFVFDDESGQLAFFSHDGVALGKIELPEGYDVPSQKIKWNPAGTAAWLDLAPQGENRILSIDVDYLRVAPKEVRFYDADGKPIGSLSAGDERNASLEVAGWMNADVAVIRSYTASPDIEKGIDAGIKDASYFLYDVWKKNKGPLLQSVPQGMIPDSDGQGATIVPENPTLQVENDKIIYFR